MNLTYGDVNLSADTNIPEKCTVSIFRTGFSLSSHGVTTQNSLEIRGGGVARTSISQSSALHCNVTEAFKSWYQLWIWLLWGRVTSMSGSLFHWFVLLKDLKWKSPVNQLAIQRDYYLYQTFDCFLLYVCTLLLLNSFFKSVVQFFSSSWMIFFFVILCIEVYELMTVFNVT